MHTLLPMQRRNARVSTVRVTFNERLNMLDLCCIIIARTSVIFDRLFAANQYVEFYFPNMPRAIGIGIFIIKCLVCSNSSFICPTTHTQTHRHTTQSLYPCYTINAHRVISFSSRIRVHTDHTGIIIDMNMLSVNLKIAI